MPSVPTIVCFSHLRWASVFQRPHHLLSRLAQTHSVYLIEEPIPTNTDQPTMDMSQVADRLWVCRPRLRTRWGFFSGDGATTLTALIRELFRRHDIDNYIFWFYTPMALHVARDFAPRAIVYDCMDELSRFRFAPAEIGKLENELLVRADLVFTGGPSLYAAKRNRHRSVHLFPSSVDTPHFAQALSGAVTAHPATAALPLPRLGYYGVIDERLDLMLLNRIATARPDWQFMMVGPVVKLDPADLPRRPNIHYLGQADYRDLPAHLAGWQVALMPFARNEATEFISPTKTLEYMAAGKPIVSTSIRDVAHPYGEIVAIADEPEDFLAACERALHEEHHQCARRLVAYAAVLGQTSWDATVALMRALLADVTRLSSVSPPAEPVSSELAASGP